MKLNSSQRIVIMSLVLFLAMICAAVFNEDGFLEVFKFQEELNVLKQKNTDLRKDNDQIKVQIERLKTDPYAIETVAREKLNMVKPQETIYQIVHQPSEPKSSP